MSAGLLSTTPVCLCGTAGGRRGLTERRAAGPEYGTTEAAWKGALVEAEQRCELHLKVRDNLMNEVHASVRQWQKENFHKVGGRADSWEAGGERGGEWMCQGQGTMDRDAA